MQSLSLLPNNREAGANRPATQRIAPLATVPLFFKLEGKKVLVAGGSEAAAWKVELLTAAGARVHLYAERLDSGFRPLLRDSTQPGHIVWHRQAWKDESFCGAAVAIGDIAGDEEADAFWRAAKASGVPVNIIDKPKYCAFQFGSIVNRSPVVIGISSDGSSPILAQAIRRRIETLIPPSLANWARIAKALRGEVSGRLTSKRPRRWFWEQFSSLAFGVPPGPNTEETLLAEIQRKSRAQGPEFGQVTLVGAGPGDAEFLTLKAVRALQSADVILHDNLVSDEVLELARREAKRMLVGKRGGRESCRQEGINEMMAKLAKAGKNVVRLKSGDPMVFGRAGEEIEWLQDQGICVSTVPGITAAAAMASALGISLTHRDHARSLRFVTGHSRKGMLPDDIDWRAVADPKTTTVFYMGRGTAAQISETLIDNDMDPATPVVACAGLSRATQKTWFGNLEKLGAGVQALLTDEPVLIGVGSVFGVQERDCRIPGSNAKTRISAGL
ncbi:siroheme synthase CysG [Denitrobaculum tricleocarpae]|uniref:Uroporphyrinogen-III C-methyltransferase n=1 Tax=Denitrobaculum tricleocarpae TaxID=2591009 RepID=A0A545TB23_9PROT|nr:siroheme synthase CysG [Denitrobaculum tricleocarpae]TQV74401.1 uroporphyrinogen-III C-methyltransferase [Denitrobaculum tricleocarpae]